MPKEVYTEDQPYNYGMDVKRLIQLILGGNPYREVDPTNTVWPERSMGTAAEKNLMGANRPFASSYTNPSAGMMPSELVRMYRGSTGDIQLPNEQKKKKLVR